MQIYPTSGTKVIGKAHNEKREIVFKTESIKYVWDATECWQCQHMISEILALKDRWMFVDLQYSGRKQKE